MSKRFKPIAYEFSEKLVKIDEFTSAWRSIEYTHMCHSLEPRCMMLLGESGNGKTALIRDYMKAHAVTETDELSPKPVIHVTATSNVSIPDFSSRILHALGDPAPSLGTFASKQLRMERYKSELGLELICIDEVHDLLPRSGYDKRSPVIKFIKSLMTDLRVSVVLAGLPGAVDILEVDEQIKTRCKRVAEVQPFSMSGADETARYATFLKNLLKVYPYPLPGLFSSDGYGVMRLLLATGGNKRYLKDLLVYAIQLTPDGGKTTFEILHEAWFNTVSDSSLEQSKVVPFLSTDLSVKKELETLGLL